MRPYLASLILGVAVGVVYGFVKVRSPAPPAIALLGLLGMLAGEQAISLIRSHVFKSEVQLGAPQDHGEAIADGDRRAEGNCRVSGVPPISSDHPVDPWTPSSKLVLTLHLHELIHRHHVMVEVRHDPERSAYHKKDDQDAEAQCQHVVGVVGPRRDVEKEHEVHAHLSDG
jgi:XapX domain-containing protein